MPDLLLLDIMMPGISGYAICEQLMNDEMTNNIPVLFVSSLSDEEDLVRGFACGAVDYIQKPVRRHELLARVMTHLRLATAREQLLARNIELENQLRQISAEERNL